MGSAFLDLYNLLFHLSGLSLLLTLILFVLKGPIGLTCVEVIRQRGQELQLPGGMGGFSGLGGGGAGGVGGGYQRAEQGQSQANASKSGCPPVTIDVETGVDD